MSSLRLVPVVSPGGSLSLADDADAPELDGDTAQRLRASFGRGAGRGLFHLGAVEAGNLLPPAFAFWREFAARYVTAVSMLPEDLPSAADHPIPPPLDAELDTLALSAPPMPGGEYLTAEILHGLWNEIEKVFRGELAESGSGLPEFLKLLNPAWNLVGRVHFNLAENRKDAERPFAFLATYTSGLSTHAKVQHLPLGQALKEYSGARNRDRLLSLLRPVQRATESCPWLTAIVDNGAIFHPLRWSPDQALALLKSVEQLESAGVVVRTPAAWKLGRPSRPVATATVGEKRASGVGLGALLDFHMEVALGGEPLTKAEIQDLLSRTSGLAFIRGRWIEIDRERLGATIESFEQAERAAAKRGLSFLEAMRMLAGTSNAEAVESDGAGGRQWSRVTAGPWLRGVLDRLRNPAAAESARPGSALHGTLRPYQQVRVEWLLLLSQLGLGPETGIGAFLDSGCFRKTRPPNPL